MDILCDRDEGAAELDKFLSQVGSCEAGEIFRNDGRIDGAPGGNPACRHGRQWCLVWWFPLASVSFDGDTVIV